MTIHMGQFVAKCDILWSGWGYLPNLIDLKGLVPKGFRSDKAFLVLPIFPSNVRYHVVKLDNVKREQTHGSINHIAYFWNIASILVQFPFEDDSSKKTEQNIVDQHRFLRSILHHLIDISSSVESHNCSNGKAYCEVWCTASSLELGCVLLWPESGWSIQYGELSKLDIFCECQTGFLT